MKKFWSGILVLAIATIACSFGGSSQADKLADQADQLVKTKKYSEAVELYNQALDLDPNSSHAYAGRGTAYRFLEKTQLALDDLNKAIQLDAKNHVAYRERGMIFYLADDYQAALTDCNKAVSLNPNYARGYLCLGYIQEGLGNYEDAILQYTNTIKKDSSNQWGYGYRGRLYFAYTDNFDQAIEDLTKAIQLDPKWDEPYVYRGYSYIFVDRYQDAIDDLDMALSLASNENIKAKAYRGLGVAYYDQGKYQDSIASLTSAIQFSSTENSFDYFQRGQSYEELGDNGKAYSDYMKYLELDVTDSQNSRYACSKVNEIALYNSKDIFSFVFNVLVQPCTRFNDTDQSYGNANGAAAEDSCIDSVYAPFDKMCPGAWQFLQSQDP